MKKLFLIIVLVAITLISCQNKTKEKIEAAKDAVGAEMKEKIDTVKAKAENALDTTKVKVGKALEKGAEKLDKAADKLKSADKK